MEYHITSYLLKKKKLSFQGQVLKLWLCIYQSLSTVWTGNTIPNSEQYYHPVTCPNLCAWWSTQSPSKHISETERLSVWGRGGPQLNLKVHICSLWILWPCSLPVQNDPLVFLNLQAHSSMRFGGRACFALNP